MFLVKKSSLLALQISFQAKNILKLMMVNLSSQLEIRSNVKRYCLFLLNQEIINYKKKHKIILFSTHMQNKY